MEPVRAWGWVFIEGGKRRIVRAALAAWHLNSERLELVLRLETGRSMLERGIPKMLIVDGLAPCVTVVVCKTGGLGVIFGDGDVTAEEEALIFAGECPATGWAERHRRRPRLVFKTWIVMMVVSCCPSLTGIVVVRLETICLAFAYKTASRGVSEVMPLVYSTASKVNSKQPPR
jgi:hypothetical protein